MGIMVFPLRAIVVCVSLFSVFFLFSKKLRKKRLAILIRLYDTPAFAFRDFNYCQIPMSTFQLSL